MEDHPIQKPIEIVLPVFNGLAYLIECLESLIKNTPEKLYTLRIIDDASNQYCQQYLQKFCAKYPHTILHTHTVNAGFLRSCNEGINQGNSKYVLILNTDVVVTPNWLQRLLNCAESDDRIASVNPLTNTAANIDLPMIPGTNFLTMNWLLSQQDKPSYPDVVTGVGFCMLLRRSALNKVGSFDEVYGLGYCEESDLCMRLTSQGFRTVVADDVYVFHKGGATFADRNERYMTNREIFDQRWKKEYLQQYADFQKKEEIRKIRQQFQAPQRWDPWPLLRETYRSARNKTRDGNYLAALKQVAKGAVRLPGIRSSAMSSALSEHFEHPNKLRVTYLLHRVTVSGGVISVMQLVNELILLGVEARIVTLYQYPETLDWKSYSAPIIFRTEQELLENFPSSDIVVATHWSTAVWANQLVIQGRAKSSSYFLQDYEAWFFPEADTSARAQVKNTYKLIDNKIVKSAWLQSLLEKDGFTSHKIPLGLDLGMFYPRRNSQPGITTIIAMARPGTPYRGFKTLMQSLKIIAGRIDKLKIMLFGQDLSHLNIDFKHECYGLISSADKLAELYSAADIFIDASDFQGFGRTALEAMACNTACILSNIGGVGEYARDNENCLLVAPSNPQQLVEAVCRLVANPELCETIKVQGRQTADKFSHKLEATRTLDYFNTLLQAGD